MDFKLFIDFYGGSTLKSIYDLRKFQNYPCTSEIFLVHKIYQKAIYRIFEDQFLTSLRTEPLVDLEFLKNCVIYSIAQ